MDSSPHESRWAELSASLRELRDEAVRLESKCAHDIERIPASRRPSANNLLHYLALRRHDLRALQWELHRLGLSSLGRSEPYVLRSLEAVISVLERLQGHAPRDLSPSRSGPDFETGRRLLQTHTEELLGPAPPNRRVRIMVTMPTEAAEQYDLVRELVHRGMDVMRINCASDGPDQWRKMIAHARRAQQELGRTCRVQCDLAGPNPRTGPLELGPGLVRWAPLLNSQGYVRRPARIWASRTSQSWPPDADAALPVSPEILDILQPDDEIHFFDTRSRSCWVRVHSVEDVGAWVHGEHTAVLKEGLRLSVRREGREVGVGTVGQIPPLEQSLRLRIGDELLVTPATLPGYPAVLDDSQQVVHPAQIGCSLNEVFRDARPGQRILFDDGKLAGVISETASDYLRVRIVQARKGTAKLRSGKSINLPDTELRLDAFTEKDLADLDFAAKHADLVGLSFVRHVADMERFLTEVHKHGGQTLGLVLKIETRQAFDELPRLLLTLMRSPPVGVMVARGDMGVELGFERMAEVQEEILWICEAAHVPVIWATQVLEGLAKKGLPSRAEVTDAAVGGRAECVMLNKGPHVLQAVEFLSGILERMQEHQDKKLSMLRKLSVSRME